MRSGAPRPRAPRRLCLSIALLLAAAAPPRASVPLLQDGDAVPTGRLLRFAPAAGQRVTRALVQEHDLISDRLRQRLGKTEAQDLAGRQRLRSVLRMTVDDTYLELGEGRPERIRRRFRGLELEGEMTALDLPPEAPPAVIRVALESALKGTQVLHQWVPEESLYGRHYDLEEGPEELLQGLAEDADLRALLPSDPVRPGQSWKVPADALGSLLAPAGDLGFGMPDEGGGRRLARTLLAGVGGSLHQLFRAGGDGELVATATGPVQREGRTLERVALGFDVRWRVDLSEFLNSTFLPREVEQGSAFQSGTLLLKLVGDGEFLWDPELGLPVSCSFEANEQLSMTLVELLEGQVPFEQEMSMQGRMRSELRLQPIRD